MYIVYKFNNSHLNNYKVIQVFLSCGIIIIIIKKEQKQYNPPRRYAAGDYNNVVIT